MEKKYWKSLEEQANLPVTNPGQKDVDASRSLLDLIDDEIDSKPSSRRNFLKFCGFSFATAAIATSCQNPVNTAIPYLSKPEEVTPGMANHYASTYFDGQDYNGILVKVRDGRPIKIEGNELSSISQGASSARVQGSVLSLYDDGARYKAPMTGGKESTWNAVDAEVSSKLAAATLSGKGIAVVTSTIISPSTLSVIEEFKKKYPPNEVDNFPAPGNRIVYSPCTQTITNGIVECENSETGHYQTNCQCNFPPARCRIVNRRNNVAGDLPVILVAQNQRTSYFSFIHILKGIAS